MGIDAQNAVPEVVEPVRGINSTILQFDPDLCAGDEKTVNPAFHACQWRAGRTEFLRVPEVNTRLISDLDRVREVAKRLPRLLYDRVFRFPRQVAGVEIEDVIVLDGPIRFVPGLQVPDGLSQATGGQNALRQFQARETIQKPAVDGIFPDMLHELLFRKGHDSAAISFPKCFNKPSIDS